MNFSNKKVLLHSILVFAVADTSAVGWWDNITNKFSEVKSRLSSCSKKFSENFNAPLVATFVSGIAVGFFDAAIRDNAQAKKIERAKKVATDLNRLLSFTYNFIKNNKIECASVALGTGTLILGVKTFKNYIDGKFSEIETRSNARFQELSNSIYNQSQYIGHLQQSLRELKNQNTSGKEEIKENDTCTICMESVVNCITECKHTFCRPCIKKCIDLNNDNSMRCETTECPLCRRVITETSLKEYKP